MTERKAQKIAVICENADSDKNLILHGIKLAAAFGKEIFFVYRSEKPEEENHIKNILLGYQKIVQRDIPALPASFEIFKGKPADLIAPMVDGQESIVIILRNALFSKWSKAVRNSPVPFLFVNETLSPVPDYQKVVLPVDLRSESKDSILWASYFARFNHSGINVLAANDKVKENIKAVQKNILRMKKLFSKFNLGLKVFKGKEGSLKIQFEALELAKSSKAELLIVLGSSYISILDKLIGLPENKIIKNAGTLPILMINPRRDMYIMCD